MRKGQALLSALVNKLGDGEAAVAAKASQLLLRLLTAHPNMKPVVVAEVERLVYRYRNLLPSSLTTGPLDRPNISQRAQFYGVCTLSQVMLAAAEVKLAATLLRVYFALFKIMVGRLSMEFNDGPEPLSPLDR